eukprot:TRINITY_DN4135_c0_g2_i1.p1 TRINITY_DN4135_c0_g2~~TRINITY_DN4135_c0_g2_i1.p1  ORF type:complete len:477 (+),score=38.74 TRINITY_DN4135_c0_g2_i1:65-1495(+)
MNTDSQSKKRKIDEVEVVEVHEEKEEGEEKEDKGKEKEGSSNDESKKKRSNKKKKEKSFRMEKTNAAKKFKYEVKKTEGMAFKGARTSLTQRQIDGPPGLLAFVPAKEQADFHLFLYSFYSTWKKERSRCFFAARRSHKSNSVLNSLPIETFHFTSAYSYTSTSSSYPTFDIKSSVDTCKSIIINTSSVVYSCTSYSTSIIVSTFKSTYEDSIIKRSNSTSHHSIITPSANRLNLPDLVAVLQRLTDEEDNYETDYSNLSDESPRVAHYTCASPDLVTPSATSRYSPNMHSSTATSPVPVVSNSLTCSPELYSRSNSTCTSRSISPELSSSPSTTTSDINNHTSIVLSQPEIFNCPYSSIPVEIVYKIEEFPRTPFCFMDSAPDTHYCQQFYHKKFEHKVNDNMFNLAINCIREYHSLEHVTIILAGSEPRGFVFCIKGGNFSGRCRYDLDQCGLRTWCHGRGTCEEVESWSPNLI